MRPGLAPRAWKWLARELHRFAQVVQIISEQVGKQASQPPGAMAARFLAHGWLGVPLRAVPSEPAPAETAELTMRVTKDFVTGCIVLEWSRFSSGAPVSRGVVLCPGRPVTFPGTLGTG